MKTEHTYQETLDYLYKFVDYSLTHAFPEPEFFDLDRIREFLAHLGNPHQAYPVIHIAGTKGKGSVAAMCASALQAAGYQVGLYTSPHLQDYTERIQLNGQPIPQEDLVALVDEIRPYLDRGTMLTTFEITTALAFWYFARQGATAVVAEVGLGGRLDATNVVSPVVAVITSLSYDHTKVLGETLAEIAGEKAGIIKPETPVVVAPQKPEALKVIEDVANKQRSPLIRIGRDYLYEPVAHDLHRQTMHIWKGVKSDDPLKKEPIELEIPLLGAHQLENAATAYAALQVARQCGLALDERAIQTGFANVFWPGRFEILQAEPTVIIDSAHNGDSASKLRATLDEYFPQRPLLLIFGASLGKDVNSMLMELMPITEQVIATRSYHPRSMKPERLAEFFRPYGKHISIFETIEEALEHGLQQVGKDRALVVTGSLFVAAAARHAFLNRPMQD